MKRKYLPLLIPALLLLLILSFGALVAFGADDSPVVEFITSQEGTVLDFASKMAKSIREVTKPENKPGGVVAVYRDEKVLKQTVDVMYENYKNGIGGIDGLPQGDYTWKNALDNILLNMIIKEEAKNAGLEVTEEEISKNVNILKDNYENFPKSPRPSIHIVRKRALMLRVIGATLSK